MSLPRGLVRFGELSDTVNNNVTDSVSSMAVSLSSGGVSQLTLTLHDSHIAMENSGYFVIRREVHYADLVYEVAAVEVDESPSSPGMVTVTARSQPAQKLKRDKGAANFGSISPTVFAKQMATNVGLKFFGETSPSKGAIIRTYNEKTKESSWDILNRLANDLEFVFFEDGQILYFASEKFIIEHQTRIDTYWPATSGDPYFMHSITMRRSDDQPFGQELSCTMSRDNAVFLTPGMGMQLHGVMYFNRPMMITSVEYTEGSPEVVSVSARTPEDSVDIGCEIQTFKLGDTGPCVKRIQQALKIPETSTFDYPTYSAVQKLQEEKGLPITGVVDYATWQAITALTPATTAASGRRTTTTTRSRGVRGVPIDHDLWGGGVYE